MDEKELNKKLRSDVKPGTESLAINEAQTQANQLLTEQRMNLESERQRVQSTAVRDVELRGAIELGAMSQQPQAQQVVLPPQAAGLRPETQRLLANYGVNPTITESSRQSSNSSQSRTSSTTRQADPNGGTKVTNTTNITNITNNDNRTETDIDIDQPVQSSQPAAIVPASAPQQDNMSKFKIFMSNLYTKRDQEARIQEREFRKRDWSIKRMTDKVIQRMDKISTSFAKRMDPSKIGRTIGSQLKVILTALGFAVLPKIFPGIKDAMTTVGSAISNGFSYIKGIFSGTEGGFFNKIGAVFTATIGKLANYISESLGSVIGGDDYKPGSGISGAIADKLSELIGGKDPNTGEIIPLMDQIRGIAGEIRDNLKELFNEMAQDRIKAVKAAASDGWKDVELTSPSTWLQALSGIISAALLGSEGLASHTQNVANNKSDNQLQKGIDSEDLDSGFFGTQAPKSVKGANKMIENMAEASTSTDVTNSNTMNRGLKLINDYSSSPDAEGKYVTINESDLRNLVKRISPDPQKSLDEINRVIEDKDIFPYIERHSGSHHSKIPFNEPSKWNTNMYSPNDYKIKSEWLPTLIGVIKGFDGVTFDKGKITENNKIVSDFFNNTDRLTDDTIDFDKRIQGQIGSYTWKDPLSMADTFFYNAFHQGNSLGGLLYEPELKSFKRATSSLGSLPEYHQEAKDHDARMKEIKVMSGERTQKAVNHIQGNEYSPLAPSSKPNTQATQGNFDWFKSGTQSTDSTSVESSKIGDVASMNKNNRRAAILGWLMSKEGLGLSKDQALGVLSVMEVESNLDPRARNKDAKGRYPDNGLCQWQGKHRNNMFRDWYKSTHPEDTESAKSDYLLPMMFDATTQLEFLKYDLTKNRPRSYQAILESKSSVDALDAFLRGYENGANGLASPESINNAYNRQSSWWRNNTNKTGVQPYNRMLRDRVAKLQEMTGKDINISDYSSQLAAMTGAGTSVSFDAQDESGTSFLGQSFGDLFSNVLNKITGLFTKGDNEGDSTESVTSPLSTESSSINSSSIPEIANKMNSGIESSIGMLSTSATPVFADGSISQEARNVQEYIENKEDKVAEDEASSNEMPPIIVGGDTHVGGNSTVTNNTTVVNVNDSFDSFIDTKSRSNRRN